MEGVLKIFFLRIFWLFIALNKSFGEKNVGLTVDVQFFIFVPKYSEIIFSSTAHRGGGEDSLKYIPLYVSECVLYPVCVTSTWEEKDL